MRLVMGNGSACLNCYGYGADSGKEIERRNKKWIYREKKCL